jgi:hypothetical protein
MTTTLADIENLEFRVVDAMARPDTTPVQRTELAETLMKVRALKAAYLQQHRGVLRKSTVELHTTPADRDRPNAKNPDSLLNSDSGPLHFRAPAHLRDMTLHLLTGHALGVPASGVVEIAADHVDVQSALREQGFTELRGIDRTGKAVDGGPDPAAMFDRRRLRVIGDGDLLRGLSDRASKAAVLPSESRLEAPDGPGPRPTYATSAKAFRRAFFGEEI